MIDLSVFRVYFLFFVLKFKNDSDSYRLILKNYLKFLTILRNYIIFKNITSIFIYIYIKVIIFDIEVFTIFLILKIENKKYIQSLNKHLSFNLYF